MRTPHWGGSDVLESGSDILESSSNILEVLNLIFNIQIIFDVYSPEKSSYLNGVGFGCKARDHLKILPSQAFNPNFWAESPPHYQMCHSTAKTLALPAGTWLSQSDSWSAGDLCIGGQLRGKEGGKKACIILAVASLNQSEFPFEHQFSQQKCPKSGDAQMKGSSFL